MRAVIVQRQPSHLRFALEQIIAAMFHSFGHPEGSRDYGDLFPASAMPHRRQTAIRPSGGFTLAGRCRLHERPLSRCCCGSMAAVPSGRFPPFATLSKLSAVNGRTVTRDAARLRYPKRSHKACRSTRCSVSAVKRDKVADHDCDSSLNLVGEESLCHASLNRAWS